MSILKRSLVIVLFVFVIVPVCIVGDIAEWVRGACEFILDKTIKLCELFYRSNR